MKYLLSLLLASFMVAPLPLPPLPRAIAPQVHAAPAQDVPQCAPVAKTPNLSIYLCEPDGAPPFLINSYGFMVMVD